LANLLVGLIKTGGPVFLWWYLDWSHGGC